MFYPKKDVTEAKFFFEGTPYLLIFQSNLRGILIKPLVNAYHWSSKLNWVK